MPFQYKNPITASQLTGSESVSRTSTFGSNFSVLQTGGYMEVYSLADLNWSTYGATSGSIQNSGNTIPIQFTKGTGTAFSRDVLTLNSDNMSSGRRRLGMQVFVQETETVYQYTIPNYETLWNNLSGLTSNSAITITEYTTTVNDRSQAGRDFINAWTGSTIEGVNGVSKNDARWRVFYGSDVQITGGTYFSGSQELDLYNNTGGTVTITGFTSGTSGTNGTSGSSGTNGTSGSSGTNGTNGTSQRIVIQWDNKNTATWNQNLWTIGGGIQYFMYGATVFGSQQYGLRLTNAANQTGVMTSDSIPTSTFDPSKDFTAKFSLIYNAGSTNPGDGYLFLFGGDSIQPYNSPPTKGIRVDIDEYITENSAKLFSANTLRETQATTLINYYNQRPFQYEIRRVTINGRTYIKCYLDGTLDSNFDITGQSFTYGDRLNIGSFCGGAFAIHWLIGFEIWQ